MQPIVLASSSAYRAALLAKLKLEFTVCASHIDENIYVTETAEKRARYLSETKATAIAEAFPNHLIIGSDQVAVCENITLNKPGNRHNAIQQLSHQSGKTINFFTGLCVLDTRNNRLLSTVECCTVQFRHLSQQQIEHYVDLDQPYDCAGSFKSEGLGISLLAKISCDDPNSLIGLPLIKLIDLLKQLGVDVL